jgi:hypothetical protein
MTGATKMQDQRMQVRPVIKSAPGMPTSDGAGVKLTRLIGNGRIDDIDPFLMLDEIRSESGADYVAGFPDHPHRGFETVTIVLAGRMRHYDNKGNSGLLVPGSVQWMTAGRGIVHSEMPEQEDGLMWGFQLWVNLPAKDKMTAPRYQDIPPEQIPAAVLDGGVRVRVIAGSLGGKTGPITGIVTEPVLLDVALPAGASAVVPLPQGHNAFVYPFAGAALVGDPAVRVARGTLAVLGAGDCALLRAEAEEVRVLVAAALPLAEPVARYGPFVMNSEREIRQAISDYQAGRF